MDNYIKKKLANQTPLKREVAKSEVGDEIKQQLSLINKQISLTSSRLEQLKRIVSLIEKKTLRQDTQPLKLLDESSVQGPQGTTSLSNWNPPQSNFNVQQSNVVVNPKIVAPQISAEHGIKQSNISAQELQQPRTKTGRKRQIRKRT